MLVQVKENQAELLAMCQMLPQYQPSLHRHVDCDKGHGRIETRTIDTFVAPDAWLPEGWQPLVQVVVRVGRVVEHKRNGMPQVSEETAWWVSTVALSAQQFQSAIRGHWSVENQNHPFSEASLVTGVACSPLSFAVPIASSPIQMKTMRTVYVKKILRTCLAPWIKDRRHLHFIDNPMHTFAPILADAGCTLKRQSRRLKSMV